MILTGEPLRRAASEALRPSPAESDYGAVSVDIYAAIDEPRVVESGEHLVVPAYPDIAVPLDKAVMITGRSSHMRRGVFMPAGWLDPGFESDRDAGRPLKLEFGNTSDGAAILDHREPAARLTFFEVLGDTDGYDGSYGVQQ